MPVALATTEREQEEHFLKHIAPVLERTVGVLSWQKLTRAECAKHFRTFADMIEEESKT